ncbi:MAG: thioredoxin domain-containing protein [Proteobacteria bacterium]|nr:thioredoxin domain-containing protein [Pseudomonadota bacterium]
MNVKIFLIASLIAVLSTLALSAAMIGCRSPIEMIDDTGISVDFEEFDAAVPDGGIQPKSDCGENRENVFDNNHSPYYGGDESVVVDVVNFSSFGCPLCADFSESFRELWKRRPDIQQQVRLYFHHSSNTFRHRATLSAYNQGMEHFWTMHDFIYDSMIEGSAYLTDDDIIAFARDDMGLDMDQFIADVDAEKTFAFLAWDDAQGDSAGITGTPSVFVCGTKISTWRKLELELDKYL